MMNKKVYVAPLAELMAFAPVDDIAANWSWTWNPTASSETASVTGYCPIFDLNAETAWDYNGNDKPY